MTPHPLPVQARQRLPQHLLGRLREGLAPFLTRRAPKDGTDARARLLGTTKRAYGARQVAYAGHPLYYFTGDIKPGQINCQNVVEFGDRWLVVSPSGAPVR